MTKTTSKTKHQQLTQRISNWEKVQPDEVTCLRFSSPLEEGGFNPRGSVLFPSSSLSWALIPGLLELSSILLRHSLFSKLSKSPLKSFAFSGLRFLWNACFSSSHLSTSFKTQVNFFFGMNPPLREWLSLLTCGLSQEDQLTNNTSLSLDDVRYFRSAHLLVSLSPTGLPHKFGNLVDWISRWWDPRTSEVEIGQISTLKVFDLHARKGLVERSLRVSGRLENCTVSNS